MRNFWEWVTGKEGVGKDGWIVLYSKRKALEERKKIELLDASELPKLKNKGWIGLFFKRKALEEKKRIKALQGKNAQD